MYPCAATSVFPSYSRLMIHPYTHTGLVTDSLNFTEPHDI
jgi:hypothetical protein